MFLDQVGPKRLAAGRAVCGQDFQVSTNAISCAVSEPNLLRTQIEDVIAYCKHPNSTGPLEGMNSIIMAIRRAGRGYRNAETFGMAIMFFCGHLNLIP